MKKSDLLHQFKILQKKHENPDDSQFQSLNCKQADRLMDRLHKADSANLSELSIEDVIEFISLL